MELLTDFMDCSPTASRLIDLGELSLREYQELNLGNSDKARQELVSRIVEKGPKTQNVFLDVLIANQPYLRFLEREKVREIHQQGKCWLLKCAFLSSSCL